MLVNLIDDRIAVFDSVRRLAMVIIGQAFAEHPDLEGLQELDIQFPVAQNRKILRNGPIFTSASRLNRNEIGGNMFCASMRYR